MNEFSEGLQTDVVKRAYGKSHGLASRVNQV